MIIKKTNSEITRIGSVISAILLSFIVRPPLLNIPENEPVHWNTLFVFIFGTLSVLLYDKLSKKSFNGFYIIGILIFAIFIYGFLYEKYSRKCEFDLNKEDRFIISCSENFKNKEVEKIYNDWKEKSNNSDVAINEILRAKNCNSNLIWSESSRYLPFIIIVFLYLLIAILLILIFITFSEKIREIKL